MLLKPNYLWVVCSDLWKKLFVCLFTCFPVWDKWVDVRGQAELVRYDIRGILLWVPPFGTATSITVPSLRWLFLSLTLRWFLTHSYSESALGRGLSCLGTETEPLSKFPVPLSMSEATSVGDGCDLMSLQTEAHVLTSLNKKFRDMWTDCADLFGHLWPRRQCQSDKKEQSWSHLPEFKSCARGLWRPHELSATPASVPLSIRQNNTSLVALLLALSWLSHLSVYLELVMD